MERQELFCALADPTRRDILELLAENGQMSATAIYDNFSLTHPAVSQHLKVLRQAELVRWEKSAQRRIYSLNPEPMRQLGQWVSQMTQLWEERFGSLDRVLEEEKQKMVRER